MKTIEQKAKAYDEIIERAKTMLAAGEVMYGKENNASQLITDIIPDLKESEDERIRKEIIAFIEWSLERGSITTEQRIASQSWFAYLERQKEQKSAEKQDYSGLTDFERAIHRGFLCAGVENVPVTIIKETAQDCLAHLPAEWSDEDEKVYSRLLNQYENLTHCITTADRHQEIREELNFLKSLRPQKQEWSEEDEKKIHFLSRLIDFQVNDGEYCFGGNHRMVSKQEAIEMLLSIRPSWKPSEDQVQAITYLASSIPPNFLKEQEYTMRLVDEVIEELKKL